MKQFFKLFFLITVFFALIPVNAQVKELDTVFVKRKVEKNTFEIDTLFIPSGVSAKQVLVGTQFLPYSNKMIGLLNSGLSPISLEVINECNEGIDRKTFNQYPKFVNVERELETLTIDVSVVANCCHNFLGEAEVVDGTTLNLVYTSYGGFCSCNCVFTLRYKFNTVFEKNYQILDSVKINGSNVKVIIPKK